MSENKPTLKKLLTEQLYNNRKVDAYLSENYKITKQTFVDLHEPIFTLKNSQTIVNNLTYRKVNDWDAKNIISGSRDNAESGWRKFSAIDIIKLLIITDLRKIGCSIDKIKKILYEIANGKVNLWKLEYPDGKANLRRLKEYKEEEDRFLQLEYYTLGCLGGEKIVLSIDENDNPMFLIERDFVSFYSALEDSASPFIVLPFFSYIHALARKYGDMNIKIREGSTISELFNNILTEKEKKIIDIIRNKDFQEININKTDKEELNIKAKSRKNKQLSNKEIIELIKSKQYQKVEVITSAGKIVAAIQEESIKA